MADYRLIDVSLDETTIVRWSAEADHERRVAIYDLLEENSFGILRTIEKMNVPELLLHRPEIPSLSAQKQIMRLIL